MTITRHEVQPSAPETLSAPSDSRKDRWHPAARSSPDAKAQESAASDVPDPCQAKKGTLQPRRGDLGRLSIDAGWATRASEPLSAFALEEHELLLLRPGRSDWCAR